MINLIKYSLVRVIENFPSIHTVIYNNIDRFSFLFPHEKDFYGLNNIFNKNHKGVFLDIGGYIGLSSIGFRVLGYYKYNFYIFEPNTKYCGAKLKLIKKNIKILKYYLMGCHLKIKKIIYILQI